MSEVSKEERMKAAIKAFNEGKFPSKSACARVFDVPSRTLMKRLNGVTSRNESLANGRKLSDIEENTLSRWILDMSQRGLPLQLSSVYYFAQLLLSARLKSPQKATIGELWVNRFIKRHPELKSKYTRQYDYQRAKCEDSGLIKNWFSCVQETILKYGILEQDIYNMDETGFAFTYVRRTVATKVPRQAVLVHVHQNIEAMFLGHLGLLLHDIQKRLVVLPTKPAMILAVRCSENHASSVILGNSSDQVL